MKQLDELQQKLAEHNLIVIADEENDRNVLFRLQEVITFMRACKPEERSGKTTEEWSEKVRRYTISITEMEKVIAYFKTYVIDRGITMTGTNKP